MNDPDLRLSVVLDCADPERLARFWAPALGYTQVGIFGAYAVLRPADGDGPKLLLQGVAEPRTGKNRMHLDLHTADLAEEVARLVGLGAEQLDATPMSEHGTSWIRMADPEGNEFCVAQSSPPTPG